MQATDFKKLFDDEIAKSKANSSSVPQNHMLLRQFREAIWVCFLARSTKKKIRLLIAFHLIIDFPNPPTAACLLYFPEYLPSCALESLFLFGSNRDQCFTFEWIDMGFNWNLLYGFGQNTLGEVR